MSFQRREIRILTSERRRAFTILELVIVIAIIAVLGSLLLPALGRSKATAQSTYCLNNLKQLQLAVLLYANDHEDRIVPNRSTNENLVVRNLPGSWIMGNAQRDKDEAAITRGALFSYVQAASVYRCPADRSIVKGQRHQLRLRSYALCGWLGSEFQSYGLISSSERLGTAFKLRLGQVVKPSNVFAFVDEHESAIDDGVYVAQSVLRPNGNINPPTWFEMPTDRHSRGGNFSFIDGHVEHHPWLASKRFTRHAQAPISDLDERDLQWQAEHTPTHE